MCYQIPLCLVLLVGIPGSGKSCFRRFLETYLNSNYESVLGCIQMCCVSYDDYCKVRNPNQFSVGNKWKDYRSEILKVVQNIVLCLIENEYKNFKTLFPDISLVNENIEHTDSILVLIDDNMYYRSMRYEYFKLAKTCKLSFCQIFFDITLEEALKRNKNRSKNSQVPDNIIKTMYDKIEPPQKSHLWEVNSVFVSNHDNFQNQCALDNLFSCIKNALTNPVTSLNIELKSLNEKAREITNSNALHQIDNTLKQLVSICIQRKMKEKSKIKPQTIAQYYSHKRFTLLKQIKEGTITMPFDITKPINQEAIDLVKPILSDLLQN